MMKTTSKNLTVRMSLRLMNWKRAWSSRLRTRKGYTYLAFVRDLTPDTVVLDYNPPLAGKTLTYDVEVVALREADEEELAHGHPHNFGDDEFEDDEDYDF